MNASWSLESPPTLLEQIEIARTTDAEEWNETSEKLPEENIEVLVLFDGLCKELIYLLAHYDGERWVDDDGHGLYFTVKYWRYLPEKP